jgi:hypothetical protein
MKRIVYIIPLLGFFASCIVEAPDENVPHKRVIKNGSDYSLFFEVKNINGSNDYLDFELFPLKEISFVGNLFAERGNMEYTGLGWIRSDSMKVVANDSLRLIYLFSDYCRERNPLVLVATDGCSGYEISQGGDTTIWTFTFTDEDFSDAEVIKD